MSRAKKVCVNKEKVLKELKCQGITQKDLAERISHDYIGVHRAIHSGSMTEEMLDLICRELDVAPEYFQDLIEESDLLLEKGERIEYAYHLASEINADKAYLDFVLTHFINPEKLTNRQLMILHARLNAAFRQFEEDMNMNRI